MISDRYKNDGVATIPLNELQRSMCAQIIQKIADGVYQFEDVSCAVCGTADSEVLAEKDRYGLMLPVVVCRNCGLIYTQPRMNQASYAVFYDSEYRRLYHGADAPSEELFQHQVGIRGPAIARFLSQEVGVDLRGKKVFEVGCGAGGILSYLRDEQGCDVGGCDFGREAVNLGREAHGLDLHEGPLVDVRCRWKPDILIYSHVFEHILDLEAECRTIAETLAPDGIVYIEIPSVKNIRNAYRWDLLRLLQNAHTYHFTLQSLSNALAVNGFTLVRGAEYVRAVYKKGEQAGDVVSDYAAVMRFIHRTESWRPVMKYWSRIGVGKKVRRLHKAALRSVGLRKENRRDAGKG